MKLDQVLHMLREGRGDLNLIIDHYASYRGEGELGPYLEDPEICGSILFIMNELPEIDANLVTLIEGLIEKGSIPELHKWKADEIVYNHS